MGLRYLTLSVFACGSFLIVDILCDVMWWDGLQERDAAVASLETAEHEKETSKTRLKELFVKYKGVQAVRRCDRM